MVIYPEPYVPHAPRTAPPPKLCPPLKAVIKQHLGKKVEPDLPVPEFKPLHVGRKANLLWRHRSMLLNRVEVPLPFEILCELERKAGAPTDHPMACSTQMTGGPKWHELYAPSFKRTETMLFHLQPGLKLPPRSTFNREQPLPDSPYATKKPDLLEYVGEQECIPKPPAIEYSPRQQRRLYRRLLLNVPLIDLFSPDDLWKEDKAYTITQSCWIPKGVTKILEDIPSEEIIQTTLAQSSKKKQKAVK